MKDKKKGMLQLLLTVLVIAGISVIAYIGIGTSKYGSISNVKLGLDLAGGVSITYQSVKENPTSEEIADTVYRMQQRAQVYSTEAEVYKEGTNRINVNIPSVTDANAVLEQLGNAGTIYFVYGQSLNGVENIKYDSATGKYTLARTLEEIIAAGDVVIDGADISSAEPVSYNENNMGMEHYVKLTLNSDGAKKFATATEYAVQYRSSTTMNIRNLIAIIYDGEIVSAPGVTSAITDGVATISGQSTRDEASKLASTIRIGALPLELKEIRSNVVGAKLGAEAIETSLLAGVIGFVFVILFMIFYYRIMGVAASIALTLYVGLIIIALNIFNVTLTLPGIAGIILSIGMAVDANVIVFSRIREELATGKTIRSSIKIGFHKALSAIVDGNVTTLISAAVLFLMGTGTIKGFAETLAIGIILSMFTALIVTKFILHALYSVGADKEQLYGIQKPIKTIDFVKHAKKFAVLSCVLILVGIVAMVVNRTSTGSILNYGLDFKGGSSTQITFPEEVSNDVDNEVANLIRDIINSPAEIVRVQGENTIIVKTRVLETEEKQTIEVELVSDYGVDPALIQIDSISGSVSDEMKSDAIWAVVLATVGILIYIWFRFKNMAFAGSAVLGLVHDVLVVLMLYAVVRITVGNTFIACMLTLVGYSINATIVIFDRMRENLKDKLKKESVRDIVNLSITQTLGRSIYTSLTTLIMVFFLVLLGVDSVKEFAIPLFVGIICGTYSSVCITGNLWYYFYKKTTKEE